MKLKPLLKTIDHGITLIIFDEVDNSFIEGSSEEILLIHKEKLNRNICTISIQNNILIIYLKWE